MRSLIDLLLTPLKHLEVALRMPSYFDANERRLVVMSVVVGALTWTFVYLLKLAVHTGFETVTHAIHGFATPWIILLPLLIGALSAATIAGLGATHIHYRDKRGAIHQLIDVEGDGLERAIALYYSSEPQLEQTLLGKEGVDVRWELPTLSLAIRNFLATTITLSSERKSGPNTVGYTNTEAAMMYSHSTAIDALHVYTKCHFRQDEGSRYNMPLEAR